MKKVFLSKEKYRLELRWESVSYTEGLCVFGGAYFSGPVLQLAEKIDPNNSMALDFFKQYFVLVDNVYIGALAWDEVSYEKHGICLTNCRLTHDTELHKVPRLVTNDMLVIDCSLHEREIHDFNPSYKTYVSNEDTQLYTF